jgi:flagellar hook-associated protein 2
MPVTMDGMSSGIKTDEIVKKLKDVEQKRVDEYNDRMKELAYQNEALKELRSMSMELQRSLESLYNFDSPFEKKMVETSPDGFIEGVANKDASFGQHQIFVKNLAQKLSISSKGIPPAENLEAADITINGKTAHFNGGTVSGFHDFLNSTFSKDIDSKIVQKSSLESILIIESRQEGKKGLLNLSDNVGLLKNMELTGSASPDQNTKKPDENAKREDYVPVPFALSRLSVVNEGPTSIGENQKSMTLGGNSARRLEIFSEVKPGRQIKAITFEVEPKTVEEQKLTPDTTPLELTQGPVNTINIKGITLNSYNVPREREIDPRASANKDDFDFGIALQGSSQSLKNGGSLVNIPVTKLPDHIDFFTHNKEVIFKNVQLVYAVNDTDKSDLEKQAQGKNGLDDENIKQQREMYPHLLTPARDAMINVDGIDIERDKNNGLSDVVNGATIDIKQPTSTPVTFAINANTKKSVEMVSVFLKKYNDLMDYARNVSSGVKKNADGKIETLSEKERKETPLITSSLVRTLVTGLQTKVSNAYPASIEPFIKILPMVGIGTGKPNSNWQQISSMHLQFENNDLFQEMVNKHPAAVKDFFGQDKNGDRSFDDGLAWQMVEFLKAYTTQLKQGVIQSQLAANDSRIKELQKDKDRKQASVDEYEKKLKMKFGRMEGVMSKQKQTGSALKQKFRTDD